MIHSNDSFDSIILPLSVLEAAQKLHPNISFLATVLLFVTAKTFCRDCPYSSLSAETAEVLKETQISPSTQLHSGLHEHKPVQMHIST